MAAPAAAARPWRLADTASALAVVVLWGLNFIPMKLALGHFTPFQLGAARYLFAVVPLLVLVKPPRVPLRHLLGYGLLQGVAQFSFGFTALRLGMPAALASVLMQTQVFFTALFAVALLGERPSRPLLAGLALAALGLAAFGAEALRAQGGAPVAALLLVLLAAASWAGSNIVSRRAQQATGGYDALGYVVWGALVPIPVFAALSLAFDPPAAHAAWRSAPPGIWLCVAYLGWAASLAGYGLWTALLTRHPANRVAPWSLGIPVVGIAAGMLVLGERIAPLQWLGSAGLLAALACVLLANRFGRAGRA